MAERAETEKYHAPQGSWYSLEMLASKMRRQKGSVAGRFNPSGSSRPRLRPAPAEWGGRISAWRRTQGRIRFPPLAQRQAPQPKRSSKRLSFQQCFQAPRSRRLQCSRGIIPGVLQARLYIEPPYRERNCGQCRPPRGEVSTRGAREEQGVAHPQICETGQVTCG